MAFDWLEPTIPDDWAGRMKGKGRAALVEDVQTRARLLQRLGYPRAHAVARCQADLDWEFELSRAQPLDKKAIKAIVEAVYG